MKMSIKVKSSIFLAVLLLLTVGILSYMVLKGIQQNQQKTQEEFLAQQSKIANLYIRQNYLISHAEGMQTADRFMEQKGQEMAFELGLMSGMHVVIYDRMGKERGNSLPNASRTDLRDALKYAVKGKVAYQTVDDSLYYLAPLLTYDQQIGVIQFQYSLKDSLDFYHTIQTLFYRMGTVIFIVSFLIGYWYFSRITGGIRKLKLAVQKIQAGQYRSFSPLKRKDELGTLSLYEQSDRREYRGHARRGRKIEKGGRNIKETGTKTKAVYQQYYP